MEEESNGSDWAQQRGRTRRITELLKRSCCMRPVVHTSNPPAKLRTADFKYGRKNGDSARSNGVIEKPGAPGGLRLLRGGRGKKFRTSKAERREIELECIASSARSIIHSSQSPHQDELRHAAGPGGSLKSMSHSTGVAMWQDEAKRTACAPHVTDAQDATWTNRAQHRAKRNFKLGCKIRRHTKYTFIQFLMLALSTYVPQEVNHHYCGENSRLSFCGGRATQPLEGWNQWLTSVEDLYYSPNRKDSILLMIVVYGTFLLATIQMLFATTETWDILVVNWGNPNVTARPFWAGGVLLMLSGVRDFFVLRAIVLRLETDKAWIDQGKNGPILVREHCGSAVGAMDEGTADERAECRRCAESPAGRGRASSVSGLPADVYDWEQDGVVAGEASRETGGVRAASRLHSRRSSYEVRGAGVA
ncbi:hypothetical protein B0H14DRAFT_2617267 [Mycena olivaceomarginata]|nr:hypothetical protein B0H14DRAFT_2617267 [Mycena olivaceomarginata]